MTVYVFCNIMVLSKLGFCVMVLDIYQSCREFKMYYYVDN